MVVEESAKFYDTANSAAIRCFRFLLSSGANVTLVRQPIGRRIKAKQRWPSASATYQATRHSTYAKTADSARQPSVD